MPVFIDSETNSKEILPGVHRKLVHLEKIMTAIIDFTDGPMNNPDPPHSHPHEQISYVAKGELLVYIGKEEYQLTEGDIFYVPSNIPHTVKTLTKEVRLIDSFSPIREDFL